MFLAQATNPDELGPADEGDDLSATLRESEEEGFVTEPIGPPPATKPAANPCATAFKSEFYDNDFSYLEDADYHGHCLGDCWKLMPVGQLRPSMARSTSAARCACGTTTKLAWARTSPARASCDLKTRCTTSCFRASASTGIGRSTIVARVYVEGITAEVVDDGDYLPRPIDVNVGDFLNAFIDYRSR